MLNFKQYLGEQELLNESSTADATNAEKAICYAYNRWKWSSGTEEERHDHETALSKAGIPKGDYSKFEHLVEKEGKNTAKDAALGWGTYLSHAGSNDESTNHFQSVLKLKAGDTTSKSDFVSTDNSDWNISLKKAGDSGAGAQIMSSKAGEAEGVFLAGIKHYEANKPEDLKSVTEGALDNLWEEMSDTATNELVIQVSGGKKDFANWYKQANHSRRKDLLKFSGKSKPTAKQIDAHLAAEMSILGIPTTASNPDSKRKQFLQNKGFEPTRGFKEINTVKDSSVLTKYETEYKKDKKWKVGVGYTIDGKGTATQTKSNRTGTAAVVINPDHLGKNYQNVLADNDNLKDLIIKVTETSIKTKTWAQDLADFYQDNTELKKWFLYEAGSGLFKFTGKTSDGKPYKSLMSPVANKLVVFKDGGGIKSGYDNTTILEWADSVKTTALTSKSIDLSYKTSGISGYAAIRLASETYESELPMLQEEISKLQHQYMLNEGVFSWIKDKISVLLKKIKDAVILFIKKVIKKIIDALKKIAKKGHDLFMKTMGIEGSVQIPSPSW